MADLMGEFSRSTVAFKLSLVLTLLIGLVHVIGFSTVSWISTRSMYSLDMGLWRQCVDMRGMRQCYALTKSPYIPGRLVAAQVLESIGLAAIVATFFCLLAQLVAYNRVPLRILGIVAPFITGAIILAGVGSFASIGSGMHFGFSFFLTIIAGCLCIVLGILGIVNNHLSVRGQASQPQTASKVSHQGYVINPPPTTMQSPDQQQPPNETHQLQQYQPPPHQQQQQPQYWPQEQKPLSPPQ